MSYVRMAIAGAVVAAALSSTRAADACPRCGAGRQARSEVWDDHFVLNLSIALSPFLIIGAVCVGAERVGRPRNTR